MSSQNWLDLLKDAESSGSFAPIPDGDYELKVLEATATTTSTGKPMYKVKFEVQSGPHAKRLVWDNLVVSKESSAALGFFFRKMAAMGLGKEYFAQSPSDEQVAAALLGRTLVGKIGPKTNNNNGKPGNEIKEYRPSGNAFNAPAPSAPVAPAAPPVAAPEYQQPPQLPAAPVAPPMAAPQAPSPWEQTAPPPPAPAPGGFAPPAGAPF